MQASRFLHSLSDMITILGATGNVGGKLVHELLGLGQPVRAIARRRATLEPIVALGGEIRVGDLADREFLTSALSQSDAAFVMIPPDYAAPSLLGHYRRMSESIIDSLRAATVPHVLNLSSLGAELPSGTGPIKGLHEHEKRLNTLQQEMKETGLDLNVLHLRPTYFMENLLMNVPLIQTQGIMGSAIHGDVPIPMIATRDIASYAAARLSRKDFSGVSVQPLLGERDLTLNEAAEIVSNVLGRKIPYVTFDAASTRRALMGMGLSEDTAAHFLEMSDAFNKGVIRGGELRNAASTTPTRFEDFAGIFKTALAQAGAESAA